MKPILFNTEMVKAILDGRKTQTRRVVKPQPHGVLTKKQALARALDGTDPYGFRPYPLDTEIAAKAPYQIGDVLWVRETWCKVPGLPPYVYKASCHDGGTRKWHPSIHMPREAARIFLRVTDVRVERLQDITVEGINCEGIDIEPPPICRDLEPTKKEIERLNSLSEQQKEEYLHDLATRTYMGWCKYADDLFLQFRTVWDSTIKPADRGRYGWEANPWVFVYIFERIEKGE